MSRTPSWWGFLYLKAIKGSIIFKCQDMVRNGEDVAMGSDQTPKVNGFSCWHERRYTDGKERGWFDIAFRLNQVLEFIHIMKSNFSADIPGSSMKRFFMSHWTISAPGDSQKDIHCKWHHSSTSAIDSTKAEIHKHKWALIKSLSFLFIQSCGSKLSKLSGCLNIT